VPDIPAIEAEGLVKAFGATEALAGLDLFLPQGNILGMLGPNGAGKTTAVRVLATLLRPDAGKARVLGADVMTEPGSVRQRIGLTGQYAALDDYLTGRANLVMIGQLCRLSRRQARLRADELLERFGLAGAAGRAVKTYSGGMRRRLDLAASLIGEPAVLFLDEPTTGLDPRSRAVMWQIMRELATQGTTLLLTTQYLDEADQLADRVVVIDAGRAIAEGTPDQLKAKAGDSRIALTLAPGAHIETAISAVSSQVNGPVEVNADRLRLGAAVPARDGITTDVVRSLDAAGVEVTEVLLSRPSLDDVFLALTGHGTKVMDARQSKPADREQGEAA
jgi:ABC-2 type transport system ATP-binding protein